MVVLPRAALLALTMFWTPIALAEPVSYPELADPLPWGTNKTYADLVRLVVPGIDPGHTAVFGSGVIDVRHIGGEDVDGFEPKTVMSPRIAAIQMRSSGLDRVALLLDLGETGYDVSRFVILALFDLADEPRLLDAANVAFDRDTFFLESVRLPAGIGDDLLATRSTHSNSSQRYAITALILARNDRLELVDTIQTLDDKACAYERSQRLDVRQDVRESFSDIVATVSELTADSGVDCDDATVPGPRTRTITVTYRWDANRQRYVPDSDAFEALARENEKRS